MERKRYHLTLDGTRVQGAATRSAPQMEQAQETEFLGETRFLRWSPPSVWPRGKARRCGVSQTVCLFQPPLYWCFVKPEVMNTLAPKVRRFCKKHYQMTLDKTLRLSAFARLHPVCWLTCAARQPPLYFARAKLPKKRDSPLPRVSTDIKRISHPSLQAEAVRRF